MGANRYGDAISAPYRVRLRGDTFREPDISVYLTDHLDRFQERYGETPDLVIEVVSDDAISRRRDYEDNRRDYEQAGISEYWIVDPAEQQIVVLSLSDGVCSESGRFAADDHVRSVLLPEFSVKTDDAFAAAVASH